MTMRTLAAVCVTFGLVAPSWAARFRLVDTPGEIVWLDLTRHPDGTYSVAWVEWAPGPFQDTYLQRLNALGEESGPRTVVQDDSWFDYDLHVESDREGNDLVVRHLFFGSGAVSSVQSGRAFSPAGEALWDFWMGLAPANGAAARTSHLAVVAQGPSGWRVGWTARWALPPAHRTATERVDAGLGPIGDFVDIDLAEGNELFDIGGVDEPFSAVWIRGEITPDPHPHLLLAREIASSGAPLGEARILATFDGGDAEPYFLEAERDGGQGLWILWARAPEGPSGAMIEAMTTAGGVVSSGPFVVTSGTDISRDEPTLAVDPSGRALIAWKKVSGVPPQTVFVYQEFARSGVALTGEIELATFGGEVLGAPRAVVDGEGHWLVTWPVPPSAPEGPGLDALFGEFADGCESEPEALCLAGNRFRVTASYRDHLGREGSAHASQLTPESGSFWFFAPENLELFVKVVDACTHPDFQNFWVFASGLTDVEVSLTVVDTWTGEAWERATALGEPFPSVLDTQAFQTCGPVPGFALGR